MKVFFLTPFISLVIFTRLCLAVTVGNSGDIPVPEDSLFLKNKAVEESLNLYETNVNIKTGIDVEIVTKRKLESSSEVSNAEFENQVFIVKISNNFSNVFEPYLKIGTSEFKTEWSQNGHSIKVETDPGFIWGAGAKIKAAEFGENGVRLILDLQYRESELDIDKIKIDGATPSYTSENFNIREFALSLIASKKYIIPVGYNEWCILPYLGTTFYSLKADISFTDATTALLYSLYNANDKNPLGIVFGMDIMPSLSSSFLWNLEFRLINETAFSIGGTVKF